MIAASRAYLAIEEYCQRRGRAGWVAVNAGASWRVAAGGWCRVHGVAGRHTCVARKPSAPSRMASATCRIAGGPSDFASTQRTIHSARTIEIPLITKITIICPRMLCAEPREERGGDDEAVRD